MKLEAINFQRKTGLEPILGDNNNRTLLNFWQWAYSDLVGNTERGAVAEYLVALACGIEDKVRISWRTYDLELSNGIKIEVKSSAYIQTWEQKDYSKPIFNIQKTKAWDYIGNVYSNEQKRHADIYVFALLAHKNQETINPLDTSQWEFYLLSTKVLDTQMKDAKQISLDRIIQLGGIKCAFEELLDKINHAIEI